MESTIGKSDTIFFMKVSPLWKIYKQKTRGNHHVQWENSLLLWPVSIAMLNYQRSYPENKIHWGDRSIDGSMDRYRIDVNMYIISIIYL